MHQVEQWTENGLSVGLLHGAVGLSVRIAGLLRGEVGLSVRIGLLKN